jgi:predicted nucleic-acid-binding protein
MGFAEAVKSVDTNILVRFVLNDDASQTPIARKIIDGGVSVSLTVLLETAWLLGSRGRMTRAELNETLRTLLDVGTIYFDEAESVRIALDLHAKGADIADALHLVAARGSEAFVTFDNGVPSGDAIGVEVELV